MSRSTVVLFSVAGIIVLGITISLFAFNTASPTTNNQIPATNTPPSPTPAPSSTPTPAPLGCTVTNLNSGYPASGSAAGGGLTSVDVIINNITYNLPSLLNLGNRNVLVEFTCGNGYSGNVLPLTINNAGGVSAQLGDNGKYSFTISERLLSDYASGGQVLKVDAPNANGVLENIITFAVRLNPTPVPSQAQVVPSNTPRPILPTQASVATPSSSSINATGNVQGFDYVVDRCYAHGDIGGKPTPGAVYSVTDSNGRQIQVFPNNEGVFHTFVAQWTKAIESISINGKNCVKPVVNNPGGGGSTGGGQPGGSGGGVVPPPQPTEPPIGDD